MPRIPTHELLSIIGFTLYDSGFITCLALLCLEAMPLPAIRLFFTFCTSWRNSLTIFSSSLCPSKANTVQWYCISIFCMWRWTLFVTSKFEMANLFSSSVVNLVSPTNAGCLCLSTSNNTFPCVSIPQSSFRILLISISTNEFVFFPSLLLSFHPHLFKTTLSSPLVIFLELSIATDMISCLLCLPSFSDS